MTLQAEAITVRRGERALVAGVSLHVEPGEMLAVIGANGAGKSTLLHALVGDLPPSAGRVSFDGRSLATYDRLERARRIAFLAQASPLAFPFTVRDVIALGRSPHATGRIRDAEIVDAVATTTDIAHLLDRTYTRLSGGEKQRVQLARVLAQVWRAEDAGDRLLLLDEPVASLDIGHQSLIMRGLRRVAATGVAIVFVAHDVSLAAAHADGMLALADGGPVASGPPSQVVTEATLERVFDADTHVIAHPVTGTPVVLHD
ncbi:heme ABC transporter ATP-binding protein [Salinisphaera hydrothermalis]|uniref:Heme/hemin ABC transporter ATP-binding protein n=1 Tax=Salinisphaera hydrothermalis (strain C41B8) TaxID=1304275 RepID=A0A084IIB7_SALHC|nr:heme ABC transporter ATP-binding protein [Salinisphaera hydrothermalis]KEZ76451.1 heme/hemin ABC transporter ATP-binding protein [Salinisphaera hydrothermalis C41B8]